VSITRSRPCGNTVIYEPRAIRPSENAGRNTGRARGSLSTESSFVGGAGSLRAKLRAVGFFDDVPAPPSPDRRRMVPKPWMGPPAGWVGGWVPWRLVLVEGPDAYIVVGDVEAFPTGVQFSVSSRFRPGVIDVHPRAGRPSMMMFGSPDGPRFGVGFADGRKAVTTRLLGQPLDHEPAAPVIWPRGGGGGNDEWRTGLWLWPLPPAASLTFVVSWPGIGVEEASVTVEGAELTTAADQARQLWDVDEAADAGLGVGHSVTFAKVTERQSPPPPPTS